MTWCCRPIRFPLVVLLLLALLPGSWLFADTPVFAGIWSTDFGLLVLDQSGTRVLGTYGWGNTLRGEVRGDRLEFRYTEESDAGRGWFEVVGEGGTLRGEWAADGDEGEGASWEAVLIAPRPALSACTGWFDSAWGTLVLRDTSDGIQGSYSLVPGSEIRGTGGDDRLVFTYREGAATGEGWLEPTANGEGFSGEWSGHDEETWHPWQGRRILPEPGVKYLVVIEAPWNEAPTDPDYAFGDMLKAYFARYPEVRLRHVIMNDRVDLLRALATLWGQRPALRPARRPRIDGFRLRGGRGLERQCPARDVVPGVGAGSRDRAAPRGGNGP